MSWMGHSDVREGCRLVPMGDRQLIVLVVLVTADIPTSQGGQLVLLSTQ